MTAKTYRANIIVGLSLAVLLAVACALVAGFGYKAETPNASAAQIAARNQ